MARISEFNNDYSAKSASIIDKIIKLTPPLSKDDIIAFQERYGISNIELARLSGHSTTQLSDWRNGKHEIPHRVQQHLTLLFHVFKLHFGECM